MPTATTTTELDNVAHAGWNMFLEPSATFRPLVRWLQAVDAKRAAFYQRVLSEVVVFAALGLRPEDLLLDEDQLKRLLFLAGTRTPEGVFSWAVRGPLVRRFGDGARLRVTVEVKRIAFLHLPEYLPETYRRRYSEFAYWFQQMVQNAVNEITPFLARRFGVQAHIVGLAVPVSMSATERRELRAAVKRHIDVSNCPVPCDFWVVPEPKVMFGRLLTPSAFARRARRK